MPTQHSQVRGGATVTTIQSTPITEITACRPFEVEISVCVLNFNGFGLLSECLASLDRIRTCNKLRYEVIVIDNGSSDGSAERVRAQFPDVTLVALPSNVGIAGAFNRGIERGQGRYLLILNNDTVLLDDCLDKMVEFLESKPRAGLVAGRLLNVDRTIQWQYYPDRLPSLFSIAKELLWLDRLWNALNGKAQTITKLVSARRMEQVPGAFMMVRREVFGTVGPFDAGYTCWYEDVDFCKRCNLANWENWYSPVSSAIHLGGATLGASGFSERTLWRFHGLLRYWKKFFSPRQLLILRFLLVAIVMARLPLVAVLRAWPSEPVRRRWAGAPSAYWSLLHKILFTNGQVDSKEGEGTNQTVRA